MSIAAETQRIEAGEPVLLVGALADRRVLALSSIYFANRHLLIVALLMSAFGLGAARHCGNVVCLSRSSTHPDGAVLANAVAVFLTGTAAAGGDWPLQLRRQSRRLRRSEYDGSRKGTDGKLFGRAIHPDGAINRSGARPASRSAQSTRNAIKVAVNVAHSAHTTLVSPQKKTVSSLDKEGHIRI
jgi:hypothetical protein